MAKHATPDTGPVRSSATLTASGDKGTQDRQGGHTGALQKREGEEALLPVGVWSAGLDNSMGSQGTGTTPGGNQDRCLAVGRRGAERGRGPLFPLTSAPPDPHPLKVLEMVPPTQGSGEGP